ncbi:MAG: hypothetical protein AVDCRST_MAG45-750, partial [uncultured Solirubrobacterales bacterium]
WPTPPRCTRPRTAATESSTSPPAGSPATGRASARGWRMHPCAQRSPTASGRRGACSPSCRPSPPRRICTAAPPPSASAVAWPTSTTWPRTASSSATRRCGSRRSRRATRGFSSPTSRPSARPGVRPSGRASAVVGRPSWNRSPKRSRRRPRRSAATPTPRSSRSTAPRSDAPLRGSPSGSGRSASGSTAAQRTGT